MDTTEELNDTYFYAGRPNLTASELFFIIFCEEVAEQLGIDDFGAIVAILSGRVNAKIIGRFSPFLMSAIGH